MISKVANEDVNNTDYAKESTNFREVVAWSPVNYLVHVRFFGQSSFVGAVISNYDNLGHAEHCLMTREGSATVLHVLDHAICTLEMLPNELPDARVVKVYFVAAVGYFVASCWSMN